MNYPIDYDARIDPTRYLLTCLESDEIVPFQISQPRADRNEFRQHAVFRFISDLPGSGSRTYRLALGTPDMAKPPITVVKQDVCLLIDCGPLQVRIPASQNIKGEAPGPLIQVGRGGRWVGSSSLTIVGHPIVSIRTEEIEVGPLLVSYKIVYLTESGYRYVATVECTAGMDFIGIYEDMQNLPTDRLRITLITSTLPADQRSEEKLKSQYYVTCVNGNGESRPSRIADTQSTSWRNWNPMPGEMFRRAVEPTANDLPNDGSGQYYPR